MTTLVTAGYPVWYSYGVSRGIIDVSNGLDQDLCRSAVSSGCDALYKDTYNGYKLQFYTDENGLERYKFDESAVKACTEEEKLQWFKSDIKRWWNNYQDEAKEKMEKENNMDAYYDLSNERRKHIDILDKNLRKFETGTKLYKGKFSLANRNGKKK